MRGRWTNFPIPETHVAALLAASVLHRVMPVRLRLRRWLRLALGWSALITGLIFAAWAVRESGEMKIESPAWLITTGPYAVSRNPMYLAWTLIDVGLALVANSLWGLICVPAALIATHGVIRAEERRLETQFGEAYRSYKSRVRRYI